MDSSPLLANMNTRCFRSRPAKTAERLAALRSYFDGYVLNSEKFICKYEKECRSSHSGEFYAGQLPHIGNHFDLECNENPVRVVVVGQEYGHKPPLVSLEARHTMIAEESGLRSRFYRDRGFPGRNPHMKGCTSLLRKLFGIGFGSAFEGEFLRLGDTDVHIFECFALVNFLICSAVAARKDNANSRKRRGGARGESTDAMRSRCAEHFREVLNILEPTIVVAQGHGVRSWIGKEFQLPSWSSTNHVESLPIEGCLSTLVTFSHPSYPGQLNWGRNDRTPYLLETVAPVLAGLELCTQS